MHKKKIVVIEDDPKTRRLISTTLGSDDWDLILAADGKEGLDKIRLHVPDLVITDILLPRMDGHVVLETMKREPELAKIPVIMLSAIYISDHDRRRGLELGADHFLLKPDAFIARPFRGNALLDAVKVTLGEKRPALPENAAPREKIVVHSVVDKDRRLLVRRLQGAGYEPIENDELSALHQVVHLERPSGVLVDVDGMESPLTTIARLNQEEPDPAIVVIATQESGLDPIATMRTGARDLRWKPIEFDLFVANLEEVLESHRVRISHGVVAEQLKRTTVDLLERIARLEASSRQFEEKKLELKKVEDQLVAGEHVDRDELAAVIRRGLRVAIEAIDYGTMLVERTSGSEQHLVRLLATSLAQIAADMEKLGSLIGRDVGPYAGQG